MYIIIDWHSIGYLPVELFQHSMYDTTMKETPLSGKTLHLDMQVYQQ
jgi:hypothetical protein